MTEDDNVVHVHVVNASDLRPQQESRVDHVITATYTTTGVILEVLQEDPLRKKTEFFISGAGTVYVCHSLSQAQQALNGSGGAAITCPGANVGSIRYTDYTQAKQWAVLSGASPVLSLISERKSR